MNDKDIFDTLRYFEEMKKSESFSSQYLSSFERTKQIEYSRRRETCSIKLEEGEVICEKCNGWGELYPYMPLDSNIEKRVVVKATRSRYGTSTYENLVCDACKGYGKMDWVSNATGHRVPDSVMPGVPYSQRSTNAIAQMQNRLMSLLEERAKVKLIPPVFYSKEDLS